MNHNRLIALLVSICVCGCGPQVRNTTPQHKQVKKAMVKLPPAKKGDKLSLESALNSRKAERDFSSRKVSLKQISQLLWAASGSTVDAISGATRTAPSADGFYPLKLYTITEDGIYQYLEEEHALEKIKQGDLRKELSEAGLGQDAIADAPLDIVITGNLSKPKTKYGERAVQYVYLEAGHVGQNILLQAANLNLGGVGIGAFDDQQVAKVLLLPQNQTPLYIIAIGHARK